MEKKLLVILLLSVSISTMSAASAQNIPIEEWTASTHDKPAIFYISGDGGLNKFSTDLCLALNKNGYDVYALNAKSYFDDKKTPEKTTADINNYLSKKIAGRKNQQVVFIGYSFGADVLPFVLNRLPQPSLQKVKASFLMAPSGSTDFEIHWSDIFGGNIKRSMDVVLEINKLNGGNNLVIINGSDENELALSKITLKRYTHEVLPGGHHFGGDTRQITKVIMNYID